MFILDRKIEFSPVVLRSGSRPMVALFIGDLKLFLRG